MTSYQILGEGERYAADGDAATLAEAPVLTAEGVGTTYRIHVQQDPAAWPLPYLVSYRPSGPAGLRTVIIAEALPWAAACDLVRDRVAAELAAELGA